LNTEHGTKKEERAHWKGKERRTAPEGSGQAVRLNIPPNPQRQTPNAKLKTPNAEIITFAILIYLIHRFG